MRDKQLWAAAQQKARQLEAEIRASSATSTERSNMLHSLSKLTMFAADASADSPALRALVEEAGDLGTLERALAESIDEACSSRVPHEETRVAYDEDLRRMRAAIALARAVAEAVRK